MSEQTKNAILARRARFVAAALASAGMMGCASRTVSETGDGGARDGGAGADTRPQACLTPQPEDTGPVPCLEPPLEDTGAADAMPMPCLDPAPEDTGPTPCLEAPLDGG